MSLSNPVFQPFYLQSPNGNLFNYLGTPSSGLSTKWIIHLPAFAEEMNKCRPMVRKQAQALADKGYTLLVPDLYGTGDSEGDFADATLISWLDDLKFIFEFCANHGAEEIILWGIRSGCLLAYPLLEKLTTDLSQKVKGLLFWQPVTNGEVFINQFLRLKVAAAMMAGVKLSVSDLRKQLAEGQDLEVAGYSLNNELIEPFSKLSLNSAIFPQCISLQWYEVSGSNDRPLSPTSLKIIEQWRSALSNIESQVIHGEPFWTTQEIAFAPDLVKATSDAMPAVADSDMLSLPDNLQVANEKPLLFECHGDQLMGILHNGTSEQKKGVLLVVGGPQYRVGSHRQFALLARYLADHGIPVFRFDYRGMGDSTGKYLGFEFIDDDIKCALDCFENAMPHLEEFIIWGLCDAATAAAFYAHSDPRVTGLILVNPWVRSEAGEAKTRLRHYYLQRILSKGFWKKIVSGQFKAGHSLKDIRGDLKSSKTDIGETLFHRFEASLKKFKGKMLFIISGNDLTAQEFCDCLAESEKKTDAAIFAEQQWHKLPDADHTFSSIAWKNEVAATTLDWISNE